jgi:hypothetical protein
LRSALLRQEITGRTQQSAGFIAADKQNLRIK